MSDPAWWSLGGVDGSRLTVNVLGYESALRDSFDWLRCEAGLYAEVDGNTCSVNYQLFLIAADLVQVVTGLDAVAKLESERFQFVAMEQQLAIEVERREYGMFASCMVAPSPSGTWEVRARFRVDEAGLTRTRSELRDVIGEYPDRGAYDRY